MQTSMTLDIASNGASHTCSASAARPTTSLACKHEMLEQRILTRRQDQRLTADDGRGARVCRVRAGPRGESTAWVAGGRGE